MKRKAVLLSLIVGILGPMSFTFGAEKKPKPGPLTGTWECMSHGSAQGDMPFTLYLEQDKDVVTGSVSSPIGGAEITSGALKNKQIEIHIDTPQGNYVLMGKLEKGELSGSWSHDTSGENGTWEGKKTSPQK